MKPDALRSLLDAVAAGQVSTNAALEKLKYFDYQPVGDFARIDRHRQLRTGFPEAIWGRDKTPKQLRDIFQTVRPEDGTILATRIEPHVHAQLQYAVPNLRYYKEAKICAVISGDAPRYPGAIGIVSAGTADLPVAEEAAVTAELCGFTVKRLWDVGVAGIHRLLDNRHVLEETDINIVVAGMEGALPSVVAGLSDRPTVAVPTSIGYGASFDGLAALLAMLNSCAAGIGVVNIDNGFGAAILAGQILRTAGRLAADLP